MYGEGRRDFKQEKLAEHFYSENDNGTHQDITVKRNEYCDANDQEKRENL